MTSLRRNVLRLDARCQERFDDIAELASDVLKLQVSRSAVMRAAMQEWLVSNENADPAKLVEVIRAGIVKRGRKPYRDLQQRIELPDEPEQAPAEKGIRARRDRPR